MAGARNLNTRRHPEEWPTYSRAIGIAELQAYRASVTDDASAVGADIAISWLLDPTRAELAPLPGYPSPYGLATFPTRASHGTLLSTATAYARLERYDY